MKKLCKIIYTVSYETYLDLELREDYEGIVEPNNLLFTYIFTDNIKELLKHLNSEDFKKVELSKGIDKFVIN